MADWLADAGRLAAARIPFMLVTVVSQRGSAPRENGARMLVTADETVGSIGGGQLEYRCAELACRRLADPAAAAVTIERFVLGVDLGQCCGGVVDVEFRRVDGNEDWLHDALEVLGAGTRFVLATRLDGSAESPAVLGPGTAAAMPAAVRRAVQEMLAAPGPARTVGGVLLESPGGAEWHVALFGAGHVGAALVEVLARLDCRVRWIDQRAGMFPATAPANVTRVLAPAPVREIAAMPAGASYVVMTHSHPLDLDIVTGVLQRGDQAYCGLIGSRSKRRRFERRLRERGIGDAALERLVCPIGAAGITGKRPPEIAIAVAAELLRVRDRAALAAHRTVRAVG